MLHLRLLGGIAIEGDGRQRLAVAGQPKRLAALALLARAGARGVTRDQLQAYLWPESDATRARNALNQLLFTLRHDSLGAEVIQGTLSLQLNPAIMTADATEFEDALGTGDLERAVACYSGPFLAGFHLKDAPEFEHWLDGERASLGARYREALTRLATAAASGGEHQRAIEWWRRLSALEPLDASIAVGLTEALDAAGDRGGALRRADDFQTRLGREMEVGPDPGVQAAVERVRMRKTPSVAGAPSQTPSSVVLSVPVETAVAAPVAATGGRRRLPVAIGTVLVGAAILAAGAMLQRARWFGRAPPSTDSLTVVAVAPFQSLSPDSDKAYFSAGVTNDVALYLSRIGGLSVASPAAVADLQRANKSVREMAQELRASAVLSGSVRWAGDSLRIVAQLDDPRTGQRLWTQSYDRKMADVFAVQTDIASSIAQALGRRLSREDRARVEERPTQNVEAYALYLRARALLTPVPPRLYPTQIAQGFLRQVVALDPAFGAAFVQLAGSFGKVGFLTGEDHWLDSAIAYAERGLRFRLERRDQVVAYRIIALANQDLGVFRKALEYDRRAAELDTTAFWPSLGVTYDYLVLGRPDSAFPWARRTLDLHPDRFQAFGLMHWVYLAADSLVGAESWTRRARERFPELRQVLENAASDLLARGEPHAVLALLDSASSPAASHRFEGRLLDLLEPALEAQLELGDYRGVSRLQRQMLEEGDESLTDDSLGLLSPPICKRHSTQVAFATLTTGAASGSRAQLRRILARDEERLRRGNENPCFRYEVAAIRAALGDRAAALQGLREAFAAGWWEYRFAQRDPLLAGLRAEPEFGRLMSEVADTLAATRGRLAAAARPAGH
jgi:TolB-like protein/DNA-binding SARP family transcriptional activator